MSDEERNEQSMEKSLDIKTPSTPSNVDISSTGDEDSESVLKTEYSIFKTEDFLDLGVDSTLAQVVKKFGQDAHLQVSSESQLETNLRSQVSQFFKFKSPENIQSTSSTAEKSVFESFDSLDKIDFGKIIRTKRISNLRYLCNCSFARLEELMNPRSVHSSTYKSELQERYIPYPLVKILLEDILDFADFFAGTELPLQGLPGITAEARQLTFIRGEFQIGIQQKEFDTIHNLENDFNDFVLQRPSDDIEESSYLEIMPRGKSTPDELNPTYKKQRTDPEIDEVFDPTIHIRQLRSLNEGIENYTISIINRSVYILSHVKDVEIVDFRSCRRLITDLFRQLLELKEFRKLCTRSLPIASDIHDPRAVLRILKAKVKNALLFREMLLEISYMLKIF